MAVAGLPAAAPSRPLPAPRVPRSYAEDRNSPLHVACYNGAYDEALMLLLTGHSLAQRNVWRETPLHQCAAQGHLEVMMLLLDGGADVNALDHQNLTPLHQAVMHGNKDATELLLCYGASVHNAEGVEDTLSVREMADHVQVCSTIIKDSLGKLPSLQHLCRVAVRRCLGAGRRQRIKELPLPRHLISFLCSLPVSRSNQLHQNWRERRRSAKSEDARRRGDARRPRQPQHMVAGIHVARRQQ